MIDKSGELKGTEAELPLLEMILQRRDKINEHLQEGSRGKHAHTIGSSLTRMPHQKHRWNGEEQTPSGTAEKSITTDSHDQVESSKSVPLETLTGNNDQSGVFIGIITKARIQIHLTQIFSLPELLLT